MRIARFIFETSIIRVILVLANVLFSHIAIAQEYEISFRQFREHNGLSNEQVRCLHFGSDGFLWIGTNDGLNRFDGKEFFVYRNILNEPNTIPGNIISDIKEDKEGQLWITTRDGGLCSFDCKSQKFKSYKLISPKDSSLVKMAFCLAFDEQDRLHVGTKYGVFISNNKNDFWQVENKRQAQVMDLEQTSRGLYTGAIVAGIGKIRNDNYFFYPSRSYAPQSNIVVERYFEDSQKRIWLGAWDNMFHELLPNNTLRHINFSGASAVQSDGYEIHAITEVEKGVLWLGVQNGDLWRYNVESDQCYPLRVSSYVNSRINGSRIYCMITDPQGRVWVGTNAGLYMYDPAKLPFNVTWLENNASVNQLIEYNDKLYVGTSDGLFVQADPKKSLISLSNIPDKEIHSFYIDKNKDLYIGTNRSFYKFNPSKIEFDYPFELNPFIDLRSIASSRVNCIGEFTLNNVDFFAVNTYGHGTVILNKKNRRYILSVLSDSTNMDNLVNQIFNDSQNNLWFASNVIGISKIKNLSFQGQTIPVEQWDVELYKSALSNTMVQSYTQKGIPTSFTFMIEDSPGKYWITARSFGLVKFDPNSKDQPYTLVLNSPRSIDSVIKDKLGNLWMNSTGSLYCFQPESERWINFTANDGIPHAGLSGKLFLSKNGDILAGGNGFFLQLDPQNVNGKIEIPKATITHIKVLDNYMDSLIGVPNFELNPDQNFITFQFSSLCFSNPESITFEYLLEGIENIWHSTNSNDFISFTQLPYGTYTLRLRARQNGSNLEFSEVAQTFTILAPYYRRAWFLSLIFLLATFLILAFVRYRIKERQKMDKIRNKIARDLHDDIGSALGSISFYSETAIKNLNANKNKEASAILQKMGSTSREMIENIHDIVWTVDPKNDDTSNLIERMQTFAKDICASNNLKLHLDTDDFDTQINLSMDVRKNVYLIFKEAVYNSVKHGKAGELTIRFFTEDKNHILEIFDNGIGFDSSASKFSGNGLKNFVIRAKEIKGEIELHSEHNKGTQIILRF